MVLVVLIHFGILSVFFQFLQVVEVVLISGQNFEDHG